MSDENINGAKPVQQNAAPVDEKLQKALDRAFHAGGSKKAQSFRNFLNGTWLGEPLHIVLTDIPTGAWTAAAVLDVLEVGAERNEYAFAADACVAIGLAGALGAALTGLADWSDVDPPARRIGMYHGMLNLSAAALYATSLIFRKRKNRVQGRAYAALGFCAVGIAAKLGGKMVYQHRVGVDRTSGETFPEKFVAVMPESRLQQNKPMRAEYKGTPIVIVQRGERVFALAETCSHFGGPLSEGSLEGDSIVCPWHGSRFSLETGRVLDGPAVHPQPCMEARVHYGQVEVRRARGLVESLPGLSADPGASSRSDAPASTSPLKDQPRSTTR